MPLRNGRDSTSHIFSTVDNSSYSVFKPAETVFVRMCVAANGLEVWNRGGDMIGPDFVLLFYILWFRNIFYSNLS
jgi:hypothetical protein